MSIYARFSGDMAAISAAVFHSQEDVLGYFADSIAAGDPPNCEVIDRGWLWPGPVIAVVMKNTITDIRSTYVWNFETSKPQLIETDIPPGKGFKGPRPRPEESTIAAQLVVLEADIGRGLCELRRKQASSMGRAARAWFGRYE